MLIMGLLWNFLYLHCFDNYYLNTCFNKKTQYTQYLIKKILHECAYLNDQTNENTCVIFQNYISFFYCLFILLSNMIFKSYMLLCVVVYFYCCKIFHYVSILLPVYSSCTISTLFRYKQCSNILPYIFVHRVSLKLKFLGYSFFIYLIL